jgi:cytochrome c-type biogenesis protein CcmH/NrfG
MGDAYEPQKAAQKATSLQPKSSKYWLLLAQILKSKKLDSAREAFETALALNPSDQTARAEYADDLARNSDLVVAERAARLVLAAAPDNLRASGALGLVLAERDDPAALPLLLKARDNDSQDVLVLRTLARLSKRLGKSTDAEKWLREAVAVQLELERQRGLQTRLESNPKDIVALQQMAAVYARRNDALGCLQFHARAEQKSVDAPGPLLFTASDLRMAGFVDSAQQLARQALQNNPTDVERASAEKLLSAP